MARRTEARIDWKHLLVYGVMMLVALLIGGVAIWAFIQKQTMVIAPAPLPKVTVVTADPKSALAASWITLLTKAEVTPTLVPIEKFEPIDGVVLFCDAPSIPPRLRNVLGAFVQRGGSIIFTGMPPQGAIGRLQLSADVGQSDDAIKFAEGVSPILARLNAGGQVWLRRGPVALLKESPRMVVDARWRTNARAAIMHLEDEGGRILWFGFDPSSMLRDERQLLLILKSSVRWAAGQPISEGAIGSPQAAKTLTPDARKDARAKGFVFSVDPLPGARSFSVRMTNRGPLPLSNPTVKVWLPPHAKSVWLAGDIVMNRNVTLSALPDDRSCLISLPSLQRGEERVLKIKVALTKP